MNKKMLLGSVVLVIVLASCNNPAGPQFRVDDSFTSTGIDGDTDTGLVAGLGLEGDAILTNPDVEITLGVEWVPGLSGNAMRTDEDGDFLRITDDNLSDHVNAGTVEAWVYPEGANYYTGIVHKGEQTDFSDESWSLQFHADRKPYFYFVGESGTDVSLTASDQIPLNTWSHLSATWNYDVDTDTTDIILYVNGTAVVTKSETGLGPAKASDGDVLIGSQLPEQYNATYGHLTFMGIIDEVAMYDRQKTEAEVLSDYLALAP